ncbi:MAG: DUF4058 domain-containing protein, partial [Planctomycetaceae bacterium]
HPPLSDSRDWHGFHTPWAAVLAADLNRRLPDGWWAQPEVIYGVELDVGVVEEADGPLQQPKPNDDLADWTAPPPDMVVSFDIDDESVEIQVLNSGYGPSLMAAIELVSSSNKDRPATREAFVAKCLSILNDGAGLMVVDIVTARHAALHHELLRRLGGRVAPANTDLCASTFQVTEGADGEPELRIWQEPLSVGASLPILPLWLRIGPMFPIDLQRTYLTACEQLKIKARTPLTV